jgi:membrane-bound metal-dependent hydrolase YbcI (DUF457 family)
MPFTPLHMGPGILIKALLQGSFSLMVFGWTQIVMDIQPLLVVMSGEGHLHGFTHTYVGATLIALFSAISGKYLADRALVPISNGAQRGINLRWRIVIPSAFAGSYSHVILDSIMHADIEPLSPFSPANALLGILSLEALHSLCIYSGIAGAAVYFALGQLVARRGKLPL